MKNKKIIVGLGFGAVAGIIEVIPMIMQGLSWDTTLSAFVLWVVSGFLIATSELKLNTALKGLLISALVLAPTAILIGRQEPFSLIPIGIMTLILGSFLGYAIEKFGQ